MPDTFSSAPDHAAPSRSAAPIRVLILEDNPSDADLMVDALRLAGFDPQWERVDAEADFVARLTPGLDLILSDYSLPQFSGTKALRLVRSRGLDVPFILVSGSIGEDIAVEAMRDGADDYLLKDRMARLGPAVLKALEERRLRTERKRAESARRESDARFRQMAENIHEVFYLTNATGTEILYISPAYESIWGRSCASLYARPESWIEAIHPDDRPHVTEGFQKGLLAGHFELEYRVVRPDGSIRWIHDRGFPIRDDRGALHRIAGISEDITERRRAADELRESERRFSDMLGKVELISMMLDRDARITYCNDYLLRLTGWRREEVIGRNWFEIFIPPGTEHLKEVFASLIADQPRAWHHENEILTRAGERRLVRWSNTVLRTAAGEVVGTASIGEDITERKKAEDSVRRLNRVYAVLSGINTLIVRVRDCEELFSGACRIAVEHGSFGIAWIGTADWKTKEVTSLAWAGPEAARLLRNPKISLDQNAPEGRGLIARALESAAPVFDNDMLQSPDIGVARRTEAIQLGYRSFIALPLIVEGKVAGVLSLFAKEPNFFNEEELRLLTELAGDISFAMEHIASQHSLEKLSRVRAVSGRINAAIVRAGNKQALYEDTCRIAVEQAQLGSAWIGALDPATLDITPVAWAGAGSEEMYRAKSTARDDPPRGQGAVSRAVRERRVVTNNDLSRGSFGGPRLRAVLELGFRSVIALPLFEGDAIVGTLTLYAKEPNFFDEEEVSLLTEVTGNISFALEHMARREKIDKLSRIRSLSSEVNAATVRIHDRDTLLQEACRIAAEHGKFPLVWVGALDLANEKVRPVASVGFTREAAHAVNWASINAARGTLGEAMRLRKTAVRNDIEAELPVGKLREAALDKGCLSTACIPLVVDDSVVALIALFAGGRGFFDNEELGLLGELAGNLSLALQDIARQEKLEKLSRIRAVMSEINAAIVRIRDRQSLFEEACRIAVEHGKFEVAWIGTLDRASGELRPVVAIGLDPELIGLLHASLRTSGPEARGTIARAIHGKQAVWENDFETDPGGGYTRARMLERGFRSAISLPLLVDGEVDAVFVLYSKERGFFSDDEIAMLSELASDVSFALQGIAKQDKLDYLSYYDPLTALPNRTLFVDRAGQQMRLRGSEPLMVAMILINIERFRNINETFGRDGGDVLLGQVAQRLETAFHGKDYVARIAADTFGVVIHGVRDVGAIVHALEGQVLRCFRDPYRLDGDEARVAARAGIAMFPADGGDADTLFKNAEAALKKTRDSGERYLFYASDMNARAAHALSLETRLRRAVEAREFVLHYQPKFDLARDRICGLEALIRWEEPGAGLVAPGLFIPLLEETGLIAEVGTWVLAQALKQHREWTARGCKVPRIAVNVSAIQLQRKDFADMVTGVVRAEGDNADALELEVTESLLMKDVQASIHKLSALRGLGMQIAMDDFGTGYSSLSYIAQLPINSLKIDRSFINGMAGNSQDMSIVSTIIALAHSLNLRVVAEGVETEDQAKLLRLLKCDEAQGFLFSKPLPAADIEALLRAAARPQPGHGG